MLRKRIQIITADLNKKQTTVSSIVYNYVNTNSTPTPIDKIKMLYII